MPLWCGSAKAQSERARSVEEKRARRKSVGDLSRCFYCGVKTGRAFDARKSTVDHLKPVSLGGTDRPENLVSACFRCNLEKGSLFSARDVARVAWHVLKARLLLLGRAVDKRLAPLRSRCVNWLARKGRT